jgi:hypothetical protein
MSRIRLNSEYRNKIANRMRLHLEQENTQEKEAFFQARETIKPLQDETWKLAETIVRRHYTDEDVKMAYHLQNKFDNVSTIAKDSCFHFGYKSNNKEDEDYNKDNETITKHFDFRLDGNINGIEDSRQNDFAYAYFRDELKGREGCNPDINIEQDFIGGNKNPHWDKIEKANEKYLGNNVSGDSNQTSYSAEWNNDYKLDLIGREYCRDRQIDCTKQEFDVLMIWQQAKGKLITCHQKWIKSILDQMTKVVKPCLKSWKYLDEAIDFATKAGLNISEEEIIRTNSTGLTLYNPENAVAMLNSMKNKSVSREDKIKARLLYEKGIQSESVK